MKHSEALENKTKEGISLQTSVMNIFTTKNYGYKPKNAPIEAVRTVRIDRKSR